MEIGFIGLGGMGRGIAANLLKAGHALKVWNRSPGPVAELTAQGATQAVEISEALQGDVVFSILADDQALREALLQSGALAKARKTLIHVNMATISLEFAAELAKSHQEQGLAYFAAPVFGRPDAAASGKLNIIAAGDAESFHKIETLLSAVGQVLAYLGDDPLRANAVKIAGNFMIASAIESLGEAMALVRGHGVAAQDFLAIVTHTLFNTPVYKNYGSMIAEERYEPAGFKLPLGLKDVRLALAAGEAAHVPLPLASLLRDNFLDCLAHGDAAKDWAALGQVASRRAGLDKK